MPRLVVACAAVLVVASSMASLAVGGSRAADQWVVRDLGTLGGGWSGAVAINARGWIIGQSETKNLGEHAFLWRNGKMIDLGTLGGKNSTAVAISGSGWIIGQSETKNGRGHAFLWRNGKMIDLGTLGGSWSDATAVNDRGLIVGESETRQKDSDGATISHAFLWEKGRMRDLGTLGRTRGPTSTAATGIDGASRVVGYQGMPWEARAFVWQAGRMQDLGTLGGPHSYAQAINDRGQIVGWSRTGGKDSDGFSITHAFLWQSGRMRDLGSLGGVGFGGIASLPVAINARGQVIGESATGKRGTEHAFLWESGRMRDLGAFTPQGARREGADRRVRVAQGVRPSRDAGMADPTRSRLVEGDGADPAKTGRWEGERRRTSSVRRAVGGGRERHRSSGRDRRVEQPQKRWRENRLLLRLPSHSHTCRPVDEARLTRRTRRRYPGRTPPIRILVA